MGKGIRAVIKLLCLGFCLLFLAASKGLAAAPLSVTSPDGTLTVTLELSRTRSLTFRASGLTITFRSRARRS